MTAGALLLLAAVFLPWALAAALAAPGSRPAVVWLMPFAPWPAVLLAFMLPEQADLEQPAILLGLRLGVDAPALPFAVLTAVTWSAAILHLRPALLPAFDDLRFVFCVLAAMGGNLGALFALDPPGFYLFFAVLTVASYGLIVARPSRRAHAAGRLYLSLALLGEMLLLAAFILHAAEQLPLFVAVLLYFGLGAKLGVLPLHVALPPAYRAAPPTGGALLGGALLTAAVLGWLRFFPLAQEAWSELSGPMAGAGLAAAFYAAAIGTLQHDPRAVLGYSTVSQMGILTAGLGLALGSATVWEAALPAVTLFALHHGLVKPALFLGLEASRQGFLGRLVFPALVLLSLALAAAPWTGGHLAKAWIEATLAPAQGWVHALLPLASVATTVLMARFLWLVRQPLVSGAALRPPWPFLLLFCAAAAGPWLLLWVRDAEFVALAFTGGWLGKALWPVGLGAAIALAGWALGANRRTRLPRRQGDAGVLLGRLLGGTLSALTRLQLPAWTPTGPSGLGSRLERIELRWGRLGRVGLAYLLVVLALVLLLGLAVPE